VYTSLLNVLHDTTDGDIAVLVTQGVNIKLISSVHVLVNQDRSLWIYFHCILYVPLQICLTAYQSHHIVSQHAEYHSMQQVRHTPQGGKVRLQQPAKLYLPNKQKTCPVAVGMNIADILCIVIVL